MEHLTTTTLETRRLILRPLTPDDFEAVQSWAGSPENTHFMFWGPNTVEETRAFLQNTKPGKDFAVVLRASGAVIGSCDIRPARASDTAELGWILHMDHWGRGYGTELAGELIRYAFEDVKLRRVFAECAAANIASYRVMEKNGMRREATYLKATKPRSEQEWGDAFGYALLAEEYAAKGGAALPIRPIDEEIRPLVTAFLTRYWSGSFILTRGERIDLATADGFALVEDGKLSGVVTYIHRGEICEIVSLNSLSAARGIGTALIDAVADHARTLGCTQLRLLTTNDNLNAIGFYQKRGFDLVGVNLGAMDKERELKPGIPLIGQNSIPLHHEIDFAMAL